MRITISQNQIVLAGQQETWFRRASRTLERGVVPPLGSQVEDFFGELTMVEQVIFNDSLDAVTLYITQRQATEADIEKLRAAGFTIQST